MSKYELEEIKTVDLLEMLKSITNEEDRLLITGELAERNIGLLERTNFYNTLEGRLY